MHTDRVDIEFDPGKAARNLSKHKVSFAHAEQALHDPMAVTIEDPGCVRKTFPSYFDALAGIAAQE